MNNTSFAGLLLLFLTPFIFAQEAAPDEPGIVLPPTLLEVEDLQVEEISALIPGEDIQLLPELSVPLPQADDIFLPEEQFDIPYPDQLSSGQVAVVPRNVNRADIFSEGQIAAGSMNHVRGDLNLYRLGPDPRFDLRFYHDKIDGYGLRSAGSGFFHSDDLLEGNLAFSTDSTNFSFEGGITESSEGLQGRGSYEILTYRQVYGEGALEYPISESAEISASVGAAYAQQILSSEDPAISSELEIDAVAGFSIGTDVFGFDADLDYMLLNVTFPVHRVTLDLGMVISAGDSLVIQAGIGTQWDSRTGFLLPFNAAFDWRQSEMFSLSANGGYFVDSPTFGSMRAEDPLLEMGDTLGISNGWFLGSELQVRLLDAIIISEEVDYIYAKNAYQTATAYTADSGLFAVTRGSNFQFLDMLLTVEAELGPHFSIIAGWTGRFLSSHSFLPAHSIDTGLKYRSGGGIFGGDLTIPTALSNPFVLPEIGLSGYYRLSESVKFNIDIIDPLAPLITGGRIYRGPYEAPGLNFYLGTNISL